MDKLALLSAAFVLAPALIILLIMLWCGRRARVERYPAELAHARLIMSEQDVYTDYPRPLAGRPDEVYRHPNGELIPVETKTRSRTVVRAEDRVQLSVYAVLLRHSSHRQLPGTPGKRGRQVASYGYVRIVTPEGTCWRKVALMSEADVVRLYERRIALEGGRVRPRGASRPGVCRRCTYRERCPARAA